jgi:hypothetical protein
MPRIRTIKPDFWDSPDVARASLRARLLYIAMWNWADDWGVGDAHPGRLITFAFPNDSIATSEVPRLLSEVSRVFSVKFFDYDGRPYYYLPTWEKHQRTEKRAKQRVPVPSEDELTLFAQVGGMIATSDGISEESLGSSGVGRGKGEEGNRKREVGSSAPTVRGAVAPRDPDRRDSGAIVAAWIDTLPQRPPGRVIGQVAKEIKTMLDEGIDPDLIRAGVAEWQRKGLHPSTLASVVHEISTPHSRGDTTTERVMGWLDPGMLQQPEQRAIGQ